MILPVVAMCRCLVSPVETATQCCSVTLWHAGETSAIEARTTNSHGEVAAAAY